MSVNTTMRSRIVSSFLMGVALGCVVLASFSAFARSKHDHMSWKSRFSFRTAKKTISITVNLVDIQTVIRAFAKQTGINVVISDDIQGKITLMLENANPIDALTSILNTKGFSWYAQDRRTIVITGAKISHTFALQFAKAEDVAKSLEKAVGSEGTITLHEASNSIVVNGTTALLLKIGRMLRRIDRLPKQVLVKTKIVQIDVENDARLGIVASWFDSNNRVETRGFSASDAKTFPEGLLTIFSFGSGHRIQAILNALEEDSDIDVKSVPMIVASNNKEASILVGEKLGYKTTSTSATQITTETVNFLEVGTKLTFTPRISQDNHITIKLHPEVSTGRVVNNIPNSATTETETEVTVKDGETIVIAGLMKEEEHQIVTGIPLLKDIPIIGIIFRRTVLALKKKELAVFMTPYIVDRNLKKKLLKDGQRLEKKKRRKTRANLVL